MEVVQERENIRGVRIVVHPVHLDTVLRDIRVGASQRHLLDAILQLARDLHVDENIPSPGDGVLYFRRSFMRTA
jgi:hypothetical protein